MEPARTFRDLIAWRKAHEFVMLVYKYSASFPSDEKYGLTSQIRRASVSVAANISEGFVKKGTKDKIRFLNIAQGSLEECKYYLILSLDLGFGPNEVLGELSEEVSKLLHSYINYLQNQRS